MLPLLGSPAGSQFELVLPSTLLALADEVIE